MKRLILLAFASFALVLQPVRAQRRDSLYTASEQLRWQALIVPGTLVGAGTMAAFSPWFRQAVNEPVRDWTKKLPGSGGYAFENILQYVPVGAYTCAALCGAGEEHGRWERVLAAGTAALAVSALSHSIKYLAQVERPSGAATDSFPSGHTCTAFMGAELIRLEFGPWWGFGAYSLAFFTAAMRVYHNWHWTSDLLCGAGLGILGARVGYWLLPWERKVFGLDAKASLHPSALPYFAPAPDGTCYGVSLAFSF